VSVEELRALERAHGIAAWAATAALIAAAWVVFRRPARRWLGIAAGAGAALSITLAGGLGVLLDDAYRSRVRQRLFVEAPGLGWLFERKEHLAFGAMLLGWSALFALGAARLLPEERGAAALSGELRRAARVGLLASALLAIVASVASAIVARRASF
jgi:hypothetical protein